MSDDKSVTYHGLNTYNGSFTNREVNLLEEYVGFRLWKDDKNIYYAYHKSWSPALRIVAYDFYDLRGYLEYGDNGVVHRSKARLTRL